MHDRPLVQSIGAHLSEPTPFSCWFSAANQRITRPNIRRLVFPRGSPGSIGIWSQTLSILALPKSHLSPFTPRMETFTFHPITPSPREALPFTFHPKSSSGGGEVFRLRGPGSSSQSTATRPRLSRSRSASTHGKPIRSESSKLNCAKLVYTSSLKHQLTHTYIYIY